VGALCWWGAWGPGLLPPPLKSGPAAATAHPVVLGADPFEPVSTKIDMLIGVDDLINHLF